MPKSQVRSFRLFRYQINPVKKDIQGDFLLEGIDSVEKLIQSKNQFFVNALLGITEFKFKRSPIAHDIKEFGATLVMQIGANRPVKVTTKEFVEKEIENWPALTVVVDNRDSKQLLAIELKQQAFRYAETVANMIENNLNKALRQYQLIAQIEPLFEKEDFWRVINSNAGKISYIKFFMVEPNLPELSKNLSDSLKKATKRINSNRFNLGFHSAPEESLSISEDDDDLNGLVDYSAGGGGTAHVKIQGIRAVYKTNDTSKTIQINEMVFHGNNVAEQVGKAIKEALDNVQ